MICGGVATKSGDFWWTRIVDRCLFAEVACERVTGENEATVGGFGSALATSSPSSSFLALGVCDIKSNQGVSLTGGVDQFRSDIWVVVVLLQTNLQMQPFTTSLPPRQTGHMRCDRDTKDWRGTFGR